MLKKILRILLGAFMIFAGIGHLTFQSTEFQAQVPSWLPQNPDFTDFVVLASGFVEIILGFSMIFLTSHMVKVGLALAVFFVLIFPGNISQYVSGISAFGLDTDTKRLVRLFFQPVLIFWALWSTGALQFLLKKQPKTDDQTDFFQLEANLLNGERVSMERFRGKTLIVVNTASQCGLTPQYEGLEKLYRDYKDQGLVVLGFPCNQFGRQEKGNAKEIEQFCQVNYGVSFPMFEKIEVNGKKAHPVFKYLKGQLGSVFGSRIKWNFTKFVIDKNGRPVKRFAPNTTPANMEKFIKSILS